MSRLMKFSFLLVALTALSLPAAAEKSSVSIQNGTVVVKSGDGTLVKTSDKETIVAPKEGTSSSSVSVKDDNLIVEVDGEPGDDTFVEIEEGQTPPQATEEERTEEELESD